MNKPIVCKFGGSSLANGTQFKKVKSIIDKNNNRKFIVVSAPGKAKEDDTKVTDLLYLLKELYDHNQEYYKVFHNIKKIYRDIMKEIGVDFNLEPYFDQIEEKLQAGVDEEYIVSRGEYLNAIILAKYLDYDFIDASEIVFFDTKGNWDEDMTYSLSKRRLKGIKNAVIPGFYGVLPNGFVKTLSRGGSDLTGAIVARGVDASLYENWTDVSGFLIADPRIIKNPKKIDKITYRELRELSYMGASVLHDEAIFPVVSKGIPINIKNTNDPTVNGTLIIPDMESKEDNQIITGISGRKDFTIIYIEKVKLNADKSFHRRLMSVLESHNIYLEHMPSSIDSISLIINDDVDKPLIKEVIEDIRAICKPDRIGYTPHVSLLTVVGHGMSRVSGTSAKIFTALAEKKINVELIVQGSSEINIIIGVDDKDYEKSIRAVYGAFF